MGSNGPVKTIAVINQKGGVGKTTTTVSIGASLARRGHRVLLLDMDPQANLTLHLDRRPDLESKTMANLLVDDASLKEMVVDTSTEGLFLVPADASLSGVEQVLANHIGRETILREAFEGHDGRGWDYVLIDCPPALGVLSANALIAADQIIIPMQAEYFSMQGMTKLMEVMQLVQRRLNPQLEICLILPCMVNKRTNLTAEVLAELQHHFGKMLASTSIRSNVKLAEAPSFGRTIFEHAPESNGAADYEAVTDEFLARQGNVAHARQDEGLEDAPPEGSSAAEDTPGAEIEAAEEHPADAGGGDQESIPVDQASPADGTDVTKAAEQESG